MKRIEKQNKCFSKQEKFFQKRRKSLLTLSFHSISKGAVYRSVKALVDQRFDLPAVKREVATRSDALP